MLSPHVDKLFDKGLISFTSSDEILSANKEVEAVMGAWGLDPTMNVGKFNKRQQKYLEYHRTEIYNESETDETNRILDLLDQIFSI